MAVFTPRCTTKIDVHHHIFLPELSQRKVSQNAAVGWKTPPENMPWSLQKSLRAMDKLGVAYAVLSYPAGVPENLVESPLSGAACGGDDADATRFTEKAYMQEAYLLVCILPSSWYTTLPRP